MKVYKKNGIIVELDGVKLCLDGSSNCDIGFISHAHMDHLVKKKVNHQFLMSSATKALSEHRLGIKQKYYTKDSFNGLKLKLLDNGHVFGSKALLIEGSERVLYTSDFTTSDRFFLKGFKPLKCDTLIIETTYANPAYDFPKTKEVFKQAINYINEQLSEGNNLVLNGYALGKAQILSSLVKDYDNVYVDSEVSSINDICRDYGAPIPLFNKGRLKNNFLLITSNHKTNYNAKTVGFTGWAQNRFNGFNQCFALSDHCDFKELLRVVKECKPERVYTHHGFSEEFAELLRLEGYEAKAI